MRRRRLLIVAGAAVLMGLAEFALLTSPAPVVATMLAISTNSLPNGTAGSPLTLLDANSHFTLLGVYPIAASSISPVTASVDGGVGHRYVSGSIKNITFVGNTVTVTTTQPHYLPSATTTATIAGANANGMTNVDGTYSVTTTDRTHFTLTASNPGGTYSGSGATWRQLRFYLLGYRLAIGADPLLEFALPAGGYGTTITQRCLTRTWKELFSPAGSGPNIGNGEYSIWFDSAKNGLWTGQSVDYPGGSGTPGSDTDPYTTHGVCFRHLNDDGTISGFVGFQGFAGVGASCISGGARPTPSRWQTAYGLGAYLYGFGTYRSLMAVGYVASMGLFVISGPDVSTYPANSVAIATGWNIAADHRGGTRSFDWYGTKGPDVVGYDRGVRPANYYSLFDNGDWRGGNPNFIGFYHDLSTSGAGATTVATAGGKFVAGITASGGFKINSGTNFVPGTYKIVRFTDATHVVLASSPTPSGAGSGGYGQVLPVPRNGRQGGQWASPSPASTCDPSGTNGRWIWGDSYAGGAAMPIDGSSHYGLVALLTIGTGVCGYEASAFDLEGLDAVIQVFDPADLGKAVVGQIAPYDVQPKSQRLLSTDLAGKYPTVFNSNRYGGQRAFCSGLTFDSTTNILWFKLERSDLQLYFLVAYQVTN